MQRFWALLKTANPSPWLQSRGASNTRTYAHNDHAITLIVRCARTRTPVALKFYQILGGEDRLCIFGDVDRSNDQPTSILWDGTLRDFLSTLAKEQSNVQG